MNVWQVPASVVCRMSSPPRWKYKASPCPTPCVRSTPCSPCRPVCSPCCRRAFDDCCIKERFSSSCSPCYSSQPPCPEPIICCCPRERFTSSCSSPKPNAATDPCAITDPCAPCDLDNYCIKSSPISCNPCLGRYSFRHRSCFTRPAVPYCNWCFERDNKDSNESSAKKSRKSGRKLGSRSSSVNTNVRGSSLKTNSVSENPNNSALKPRTVKRGRKGSRKSLHRSSSQARASASDRDIDRGRPSARNSSIAADRDRDNKAEYRQRSVSRKSSRKLTAAESARRRSSEVLEVNDDVEGDEVRRSSSVRVGRKSSRLSSVNDNTQRNCSRKSSFADVDDECQSVAYRCRSSSVTSATRTTQPRSVGNSSTSRQSSQSTDVGRKSLSSKASKSSARARFSSSTKLSGLKQKLRRRPTPYRRSKRSRSSRSVSTSRSSRSSRSSVNRNARRSSARSSDANVDDDTDNLIKPLTDCITGIIKESIATHQCDSRERFDVDASRQTRYCGQIPAVPCPPGYCYDGRCSTNAWNPRDRFSLRCMPFYRSGHRVFTGTTRLRQCEHQCEGTSVVSYRNRPSYSGSSKVVPVVQGASRQASLTTAASEVRSSSSRAAVHNQDAAFISSMPPPGTTVPRPTITGTSGRQVAVAAPRPAPRPAPVAGYREHYVTTTQQTVRINQDQNFNYASNLAARRSLDDNRRGRSTVNNRNQSGATQVDLGVSLDFLDNVLIDTHQTTSSSSVADRTQSIEELDLATMFLESKRSIMEVFDNAQQ